MGSSCCAPNKNNKGVKIEYELFEETEELSTAIYSQFPKQENSYFHRGLTSIYQQKFEEAIDNFTNAIEEDPKHL